MKFEYLTQIFYMTLSKDFNLIVFSSFVEKSYAIFYELFIVLMDSYL